MKKQRFLVRGAVMRKLIVLLVAVAFCVGVISSPALALKDDALKEWPHTSNAGDSPKGDDSGWDDPQMGSGEHIVPLKYLFCWNYASLGMLICDFVIDMAIGSGEDGSTGNDYNEGGSGANPQ